MVVVVEGIVVGIVYMTVNVVDEIVSTPLIPPDEQELNVFVNPAA